MRTSSHVALLAAAFTVGAIAACDDKPRPAESHDAARNYGPIMADIARRFELLGRALESNRWQFAAYQAAELEEAFDELEAARPPERAGTEQDVRNLVVAFKRSQPMPLEQAIEKRDSVKAVEAFEKMATACNRCHQTTRHGFIEIPVVPGRPVPNLGPPK